MAGMSQMAENKVFIAVYLLIWPICLSEVMAQTVNSDTITITRELQELIVTAPESVTVADRALYTPSKKLADNTNSAVTLLAGMQIPQLVVDPSAGSVSIMGGGKLSIRINGRPASERDLAAVQSKDIVRFEYMASPGMRYGDVAGVLDVIVRRRQGRGYSIFANILQSANRGWGNYNVAVKRNVGYSEMSADYSGNPMWNMDCYRDNREHLVLPGGRVVDRVETGIPVPNRMGTHRGSLQYSYSKPREILFNVQGRVFHTNDLYRSAGHVSTLTNCIPEVSVEEERNSIRSWQGDIDIYLFRRIDRRHSIFLNVVPTWLSADDGRIYNTDGYGINNVMESRGWRLAVEGVWEMNTERGRLSSGLRGNYGRTRISSSSSMSETHEKLGTSSLFMEWSHTSGKWQYVVGSELTVLSIASPVERSFLYIDPKISVRFSPEGWGTLSIDLAGKASSPGVNSLNPILQQIDRYQSYCGSSGLKPYRVWSVKTAFDWKAGSATGRIMVSDERAIDPVMIRKDYSGARILQQPCNAGFNNHFEIKGNIRAAMAHGLLNVTVEGGWHSFISKGYDYRHSWGQPFVNAQLMLIKGNWWMMLRYNTSYDRLWGEMITSSSQNLMNVGAGYTLRDATFMGGIVNPFGNVAVRSRDLSRIAGYDRTYQASGSHRLLWFGVTLNLRHGKGGQSMKRRIGNAGRYETVTNTKK